MTLNEYQELAQRTAFIQPDLYLKREDGQMVPVPFTYNALGLGEAGEVQNKIKKILRDGNGEVTDEIREAVCGELGGLLWYVATLAKTIGLPLDTVAQYNIDQLKDRRKRGVLKGSGDNR